MEFPHEKCGIFGVYGKNMEAARLVHTGLWALQHRGQESSGIASSEGECIRTVKDEGLVAHVYSEELLALLSGFCAIGHNRYGTSGGPGKVHAQPVTSSLGLVALAHNGNLPQTIKLERYLDDKNINYLALNDSEKMQAALEYLLSRGNSLAKSVKTAFPLFTGVFSLLLMTKNSMAAIRDTRGVRPLCIGKLNGGWAFSSETCALDAIGADHIRDVKPGEMIIVDEKGFRSVKLASGKEQLDVFEFVYFSRPDSILLGKRVNQVRKNMGKYLAIESPIEADVVIPVPDSAIPAAIGYAQESGIPFDHGLIKNRYIHRTFIRPAQKLRDKDITMKLNPVPEIVNGKRVAVVDDSIVRGSTAKKLVNLLKNAGAKQVHLLISSPPVRYPDFYGIDTPSQKALIASQLSIPEIATNLGVDSLHFLSYTGLIGAIGIPEKDLCTSCFTGKYPVDIGDLINKIKLPKGIHLHKVKAAGRSRIVPKFQPL
jgi:amidophosphoribosyltransferase